MSSPRKVHLTEDVARRMGAATLAYERGNRDMPPVYFRTAGDDGGAAIRVGKVASAWTIGTCATVTIWNRTGSNCSPTASSPTETVEAVANLSHDVPANSWVVIGQGTDGKWYLVDSGIEGSCRQTIGGEDITKWTGWNGSANQLLGHDENGCLKWFDVEVCAAPSGV